MTEDEAKTKWCPFARVISDSNSAENPANRWPGNQMWSDDEGDPHALCIGSGCMAWRTSDRPVFRQEEQTGDQRPGGDGWYALNPTPQVGPIRWLRDVLVGQEGGFCGLAGAQQ